MIQRHRALLILVSMSALLSVAPARAEVVLPHVFGDHMVVQRELPVPVWGFSAPGEAIAVTLGPRTAETRADARGEWRVRLAALDAGGPHRLTVTGTNTIEIDDVLVGEVWLCSGQSNMEMGLGVVQNGAEEVAAADHPGIRLFQLPRNPAGEPRRDIDASWRVCSPESAGEGGWGGFSAVGYFFGRELHRELGVPVGLIDSCWGGTRITPWTPPCGFKAVPKVAYLADEIAARNRDFRSALPARLAEIEAWITATRAVLAAGEGPLPLSPQWPKHPLESNGSPSGLYNGMIHPLVPFAIRGAIWYQGESNVSPGDGMLYFEKMKALIGGWREVWGQGDFPFYFVQIAPFKYDWHNANISPEALPGIWEAQQASLAIPNTGMVVTTDIGNLRDIHPANKQDVGKRLAAWALARTYGRAGIVYSGPLFRSLEVEGQKLRVHFDHGGGGLASRDGQPLSWFEIAGSDGRFVAAQAEIDGDTVLVESAEVEEPARVRFGWHMEAEPNLMNREGLPAAPFRAGR